MLTRVEVETQTGVLLNLPLDDSYTGILTNSIEGLGPVKASLSSSSFAQLDGEQFGSSRRGARNIIFNFALEPDWATETVTDLRDQIYQFFMPKSEIDLRFYSDNRNPLWIHAVVESADPDIFASEPTMTVSVMCYSPDFVDQAPVTVTGSTTENQSTTSLAYTGTVPGGLHFQLMPARALSDFSIYLNDKQLDFTGTLQSGDVLALSTEPGLKFVKLTRAGNETSYLYGVTPQSNWLQIKPGPNEFRVYSVGAAIPYSLTYWNRYGGL